jgi:hypothetical protein
VLYPLIDPRIDRTGGTSSPSGGIRATSDVEAVPA